MNSENFTLRPIGPRYEAGAGSLHQLRAEADAERNLVIRKIQSGAYFFQSRACVSCGGHSFEVLATHDRYGLPIQTTICVHCGLIQTNPDMRADDYRDFYINHYRRLYIAELVGSPADFFQQEYWRGQQIVAFVEKSIELRKGSLIVEIGCGAGGILHAFAVRGYRVVGTDLGAENLAYGRARGLDLRVGDLFQLELDETPALIVYSHVLEHISEPVATLGRVRELLAADGHLYVEVPGVKSVRVNVFQGDFLRTFHLAHVFNFSLQTLTNLVSKHGFQLVAGNEFVRSIFRVGPRAGRCESDYREAMRYITTTEKLRPLFGLRFRVASRCLASVQYLRRAVIHVLRRLRLYETVKKLMH